MSDLADGYDAYYQARLWDSLPEMYQALDFIDADTPGPLRELLNRIGIQAAVLRRSIDGLWADQSIETCADWVIPYIGYLVATGQVPGLDPRGQRLDVANTIHWRRRKGTLTTADAVARDITGWDTHVVEAFRGLARTRHDLDPPPTATEGLVAPITRTPAGGFADLRSAPGVLLSAGPFDETFHHADLRRGRGTAGRHGIEKFVVYCWRLLSLEVTGATPVRVSRSRDEYVFDPTGREIPLFLPPLQDTASITGTTSAWQVPGPLTAAVDRIMTSAGLPTAYQVTDATARVRPESGRFLLSAPAGADLTVSYQYGFPGPIGAGTGALAGGTPLQAAGEKPVSGGTGLDDALAHAHPGDTVTITDSRTYTAVADVACAAGGDAPAVPMTVRARPGERPLIRLPEPGQSAARPQWVFQGGESARLVLDGLFISGGDIVLQGPFEHVRIVGCTFDPGTLAGETVIGRQGRAARRRRHAARGTIREPALAVGRSVDGRALLPTRVWIEPAPRRPARPQDQPADNPPGPPDAVRCLEIDHSIVGPIRTRGGGLAGRVVITDSIVQGLRTSSEPDFTAVDVFDPVLLYDQLSPGRVTAEQSPRAQPHPLSVFVWQSAASAIPPTIRRRLLARQQFPQDVPAALADALNPLLERDIYRPDRWADVAVSPGAYFLLHGGGAARAWLNRLLLEDAYPQALAPAACAVAEASVHLNRVTVLGRVIAHRLHATDSILHGFTVADDPEDGCVRYSAVIAGSRLPRQYNSVRLTGGAALFTSTAFGQPGYGQLLDTADGAIIAGPPGMSLLAGSSAGAQLGAFPAQIVPVKERALRVKYNEYLPLGLVPVIVHVT